MLHIVFSFHERNVDAPIGFEMGDMNIYGELGTATSKSDTSNQSMMLVLSIVELMDGIRRFLSTPSASKYEFIGMDCSFCLVFRKERKNRITVSADDRLIHIAEPYLIKADIEQSVLDFMKEQDLTRLMNSSEAADFKHAVNSFQNLTLK